VLLNTNWPLPHSLHALPSLLLSFPEGHDRQAACVVEPTSLFACPGGQRVHAAAPLAASNCPAEQLEQVTKPVSPAYVPVEQLVQLDEPVSPAYVPVEQLVQLAALSLE
jgi:hypothetical protein